MKVNLINCEENRYHLKYSMLNIKVLKEYLVPHFLKRKYICERRMDFLIDSNSFKAS